jgi:thiol-disulfide isomerase/thioredoxin
MMKKFILVLFFFSTLFFVSFGQQGYEIKLSFKNSTDTTMYLAMHSFGQSYIIDSCKKVKNGEAVFKGIQPLEKGIYIFANQRRERYMDFIINEKQKITFQGEFPDLVGTVKSPESKENNYFFEYAKFYTQKNKETQALVVATRGNPDSINILNTYQQKTSEEIKKFDNEFMAKHKGTFVYDLLNLKNEKYPIDVPLAKNGRPDSIYTYYYYKSHYFDGVDFKDDRLIKTPFFADRIKNYFDRVIVQHPDTIIQELDKVFSKCNKGTLMYNTLLGHFAFKYETDKSISFSDQGKTNTFEKVFVYLSDNFITNGNASGLYSDETVSKIRKRANIIRNLLPDAQVADLLMIDTTSGRRVLNMGFDTAKTNGGASTLYLRHQNEITPLYKTLYSVQAKYTLLVFWSVDCGHCQTDIPKINESLKTLKGKVDIKVFAVQTKEEYFDKWKKFIADKKLDFINVFEPVHINNLVERFDINRTPVIFLLDKDKKIKGKNIAADQLIEIISNIEGKDLSSNK